MSIFAAFANGGGGTQSATGTHNNLHVGHIDDIRCLKISKISIEGRKIEHGLYKSNGK